MAGHIRTRGATESGARSLLNRPLSPRLLLERRRWVVDDLAPMRWEMRRPARYVRATKLWFEIRQSGFTMLGCRRGRQLNELAASLDDHGVQGVLVDCGVWNGGSTALMAAGAPGRDVWAFDSFEGLPEPGVVDTDAQDDWIGECHGAEENLREVMRRHAPSSRLIVVKGWFVDTFPQAVGQMPPVAMVHADGDWYESIRLTLEAFYDSVVVGGVVAFDDYGVWLGAKKATDEFREVRGITAPLHKREAGVWWRKASENPASAEATA